MQGSAKPWYGLGPWGRHRLPVFAASCAVLGACAAKSPPPEAPTPAQEPVAVAPVVEVDTIVVTDPELEQQIAGLPLRILEKDAQVEELQVRLEEARQEVVRAMAKLQSLATRAEAASGIAEAEIAIEALKGAAGDEPAPEISQTQRLLESSAQEFSQQNYGGSLYLATQARALARTGEGRLKNGESATRPGETLFALPLPLKVVRRSNVRDGPSLRHKVLFTLDQGTALTGRSFMEQWVRVSDDDGRGGWIFHSLVESR